MTDPNADSGRGVDGTQIAREFMLSRTGGTGSYALSIQSCDEEWMLIEQSFRPLPVEEQIRFLGSIHDRLNDERLQEGSDEENRADAENKSFPNTNSSHASTTEAEWLLIRIRNVYRVLDACGETLTIRSAS